MSDAVDRAEASLRARYATPYLDSLRASIEFKAAMLELSTNPPQGDPLKSTKKPDAGPLRDEGRKSTTKKGKKQ